MKRAIVLGGRGLFGRTVIEQLNAFGIPSLVAGRRLPAEIQIDANDLASIRAQIKPGDLVIDAAGPFQSRNLALLHAAMEIGFDVIDINDNLHYAEQVIALENEFAQAGIRVLSSASSVSAIAATVVQQSNVADPIRVTAFLAPATRHTANAGSAISLIQSVGNPVRILRDGRLQTRIGWRQERRFAMPQPLGPISGRLFESADAVFLPRIWPSLREVEMYVDTNTPGVNTLLKIAARFPKFRNWVQRQMNFATRISRLIGSKTGGIGYEIEGAGGRTTRLAALSSKNSFIIAVAPTVLAARAILTGCFQPTGLVLPHLHAEPAELWPFLKSHGIELVRID